MSTLLHDAWTARLRILRVVVWIAFAVALPRRADAKLTPPKLDGFVVDTAGALTSETRGALDRQLATFQADTGYSIVVFVPKSLDGDSIEDAAYGVFNAWKVGTAGKDNGILLLVAPAERKVRIETGKGAGGAVTDLQASDIIAKMGPLLAAARVDAAVGIAVAELEALVRKELGPAAARKRVPAPSRGLGTAGIVVVLALVAGVAIFAIVFARRSRRNARRGLVSTGGDAMGVDGAVAVFQLLGGLVKVIGAIAGKGSSSSKDRRKGGGGGTSGGGGASGSY